MCHKIVLLTLALFLVLSTVVLACDAPQQKHPQRVPQIQHPPQQIIPRQQIQQQQPQQPNPQLVEPIRPEFQQQRQRQPQFQPNQQLAVPPLELKEESQLKTAPEEKAAPPTPKREDKAISYKIARMIPRTIETPNAVKPLFAKPERPKSNIPRSVDTPEFRRELARISHELSKL